MPLNISRNEGKITIQYDQEVKGFFFVCVPYFFLQSHSQYIKISNNKNRPCTTEVEDSLSARSQLVFAMRDSA